MQNSPDQQDWAVSTVDVGGRCRFGIAFGKEATAETDPVADAYRAGSMAHIGSLIEVALAVLEPGDRVLDLGAHLGGFALTAAALGCEVLAVEASPRNAALVRQSVAHNQFRNLHVVQACVGDQKGSVEFSCHGPYGHLATPVTGMPTVTVPAVRVDDLLEERGWDDVRFIKLDVEGSEIRAIRGMPRLLRREDAPPIYFESNTFTLGFYAHTEADLKAELRGAGYTIYEVQSGALTRVREGDEQTSTVMDYLAAKRLPQQLAAWAVA